MGSGLISVGRVPTGIDGFDSLVGGGFPRGSMILLAGNPGTGKTVFGASFLHNGAAKFGEAGVYVSFAEGRDAFLSNMLGFGLDFERLEEDGKFKFLDFTAAKEKGISSILEMVISEVGRLNAKRLVIDSFSAMALAFEEGVDARIILHLILGKMTKQMGCTTLLTLEAEHVEGRMESYVADSVIMLRPDELDGHLLREMEVLKMRGVRLGARKIPYSLEGGFKTFQPIQLKPVEKLQRFQPTPDPPDKFSSGIPQLDGILNGGYPRGATVLLEIGKNVSFDEYHLLTRPTIWNFLAKGCPVVIIPSIGYDAAEIVKHAIIGGFKESEVNRLLRVVGVKPELEGEKKEPPFVWSVKGEDIWKDMTEYATMATELAQSLNQPPLGITGIDTIFNQFGEKDLERALNAFIPLTRRLRALNILLLKPGIPQPSIYDFLAATAGIHLRIARKHGVALFHGVKPRTGLYVLESEVGKGFQASKLTPIV